MWYKIVIILYYDIILCIISILCSETKTADHIWLILMMNKFLRIQYHDSRIKYHLANHKRIFRFATHCLMWDQLFCPKSFRHHEFQIQRKKSSFEMILTFLNFLYSHETIKTRCRNANHCRFVCKEGRRYPTVSSFISLLEYILLYRNVALW